MADKALSLFRIFDLAFFVPGAVLLMALVWGTDLGEPLAEDGPIQSAFLVVAALLAAYLLGLFLHGLQRLIANPLRKLRYRETAARGAWYEALGEERRQELVLYFWYLRATCWNLALAVALSAIVLLCAGQHWIWWLPAPIAAGVFVYLGWDFERAWRAYCAGAGR